MSRVSLPEDLVSRTVNVRDSFMHYLEANLSESSGDPILFLHGNPTSSYLWRNVIPHVQDKGRCLAPDLIGMGKSGKPDIDYRLVDHITYVDAFIEALELDNLTFVLHDWGVAIGLHYLTRFSERVKAVAFMEGHLHTNTWDDFDEDSQAMFKQLRTEGVGERMILEENFFTETVLPGGTLRDFSKEELDAYRAPFLERSTRKPMLRAVREIPIEGEPADVAEIVNAYNAYLTTFDAPKLLLYAQPGAIIGEQEVTWCKALPNLTAVDVGAGLHFLPEDRPAEIGRGLRGWLEALQTVS